MATESTIRSRARNAGYSIRKSRKVNLTPEDQGEFMLLDSDNGFPSFGYHYDATLEDIAEFLADEAREAA